LLATVAQQVEQVIGYEQRDGVQPDHPSLAALRRGEVEFVTLSSSNAARVFLAACDETTLGRVHRGEIKLVAISPETGSVVLAAGLPLAATAEPHTTEGLIAAMLQRISSH
jgi:uroporphyrinogen-III synthase